MSRVVCPVWLIDQSVVSTSQQQFLQLLSCYWHCTHESLIFCIFQAISNYYSCQAVCCYNKIITHPDFPTWHTFQHSTINKQKCFKSFYKRSSSLISHCIKKTAVEVRLDKVHCLELRLLSLIPRHQHSSRASLCLLEIEAERVEWLAGRTLELS